MEKVLSMSLGEIVLKGKNRGQFMSKLLGQIKKAISDLDHGNVYHSMGKIYIDGYRDEKELIKRCKHIFGIVYICPCIKVKSDLKEIEEAVVSFVGEKLKENPNFKTFKVHCKRAYKSYPMNSMDFNNKLGGAILKNFPLKVDVHNPDFYLYLDFKKENSYIYTEKIKAYGGLPRGTNGRGLLLLSGGIDSPVAGFLMAKRGIALDVLHFHSYPFTSQRGEEKVIKLAEKISSFSGKMTMYSVNLLNIQKEINKNCPEDQMTLLSRRFMMRIADKLSLDNSYDAIITGENLGQVASQTIDGLKVTDIITRKLVFRPLIGMDKINIIDIAREIGTYETSILPFEDCCTVFLPKHPSLRPEVEEMENSEEALDIDKLVEQAINDMKIIKIGGNHEKE
ncbi:tRNA uracil 4-sulfurtransferase ThiI [Peptoniphilus lacrimalis]|uniref:Probable tRNA sulfurtransferase n=1 Tax=Peptoniphilus lacrimalis TaxID=33031 RepID=A0A379C7D5_9FIRM|nr:tRNA uracil 4-sulfurtransferase ThiI [Peptoniphilus lacrimalis]SUB57507.1 Probable tRNA sulfurtransferase [Peptoniphilus lacrimalis]